LSNRKFPGPRGTDHAPASSRKKRLRRGKAKEGKSFPWENEELELAAREGKTEQERESSRGKKTEKRTV